VIRSIRFSDFNKKSDINKNIKQEIERHFKYFWEHDRTSVLRDKLEYFDSIPFKIQDHIMTKFLFKNIFEKAAFSSFFNTGNAFDSSFTYEISFGFMPRCYADPEDNVNDRFIISEEQDVSEITFVQKGEWGYCFDCKTVSPDLLEGEEDMMGTKDMHARGILIGQKNLGLGFFGDYQVLASKRSEFYVVALTRIQCYAISK